MGVTTMPTRSEPVGAGDPPALAAIDLFRFYHAGDDETVALRGVTMTVEAGEIVAVMGPSGSGKSTLLGCLGGLDEPDGGHVMVAGRRITRRPEAERAQIRSRTIGILQQSGNLLDHLSVLQNVELAQALAGRTDHQSHATLLAEVGLAGRAFARPSTLSGGEAARAGLAVALANDPPVILADEPTGEVDAANEEIVLELLRSRASNGAAIVIVTHSLRVALRADRVVQLADGSIVDA